MIRDTYHIARPFRLAMALLALCAWFTMPGARSAHADEVLTYGHITKGDNLGKDETVIYTISVSSGEQIIVGVINVDAIQVSNGAADPPLVSVTCPTTSGTSLSPKSGQATSNNAVYCRPRSADGSPVTVTITLRGRSNAPVNYGVFAQSLNQSTVSSFDGLNLEGVGINPRVIALYRIPNSDSSLQQRNLSFTPSSTSRAAALLYRADGNLRCGTLKQRTCEIYESDWTDYYMVVANAGDSSFTYDVKFTRP